MKIGLIFGTRPEAIKMAPIYKKLKEVGIEVVVITTAQHREMLDQMLRIFEMTSDYDLNIMIPNQSLSDLTKRLIQKIDEIFKKDTFDFIVVQGDTTSAFIGALVSFYYKVPVAHIEAGLRTNNMYDPFPEEINRRLISVLATVHFAPTQSAKKNLLKEGIDENRVIVTGNTVIDALLWVKNTKKNEMESVLQKYGLKDKTYILFTMHRRENWGEPIRKVLKAVKMYLKENSHVYLVYPVHPNPKVKDLVHSELKNIENAIVLNPLEYTEFLALMSKCLYIMTDSGGIQEEAATFNKPVLVLRNTTERLEAIEAGIAKLVGTDTECIYKNMKLLEGSMYQQMINKENPFGDGRASERIIEYLVNFDKNLAKNKN